LWPSILAACVSSAKGYAAGNQRCEHCISPISCAWQPTDEPVLYRSNTRSLVTCTVVGRLDTLMVAGQVLLKIVYLLICRILGLIVVLARGDRAAAAEVLVLRHENAVLRRHAGCTINEYRLVA